MVCPTTAIDLSGFDTRLDTIFRWQKDEGGGWYGLHRRPFWRLVVERYSSRKLTKPSDKLIALSALARDVAKTLPGPRPSSYLAGLWRLRLESELRWEMIDPSQPRPPYRVPSWSWASVDSKVCPGDRTDKQLAKRLLIRLMECVGRLGRSFLFRHGRTSRSLESSKPNFELRRHVGLADRVHRDI